MKRGFCVWLTGLSRDLGFSKADRETQMRRIVFVAGLLSRNGVSIIVAAESPYRTHREEARAALEDFMEVFLDCPLEVCQERDRAGLYRGALSGEAKSVAGVDSPYEAPREAEIVIRTDQFGPEDAQARVLRTLEISGRIPAANDEEFTDDESELIRKRLSDLGYM